MDKTNLQHDVLKTMIQMAPTIKALFSDDVLLAISDKEQALYISTSKDFSNFEVGIGYQLQPYDPQYKAIRSKQTETIIIPEELYGIATKVIAAPIFDEQNEVIGSICISTNTSKQTNLHQAAEQFAASSQEIGASTEQLAVSATNLNNFMEQVLLAQQNLTTQVESSAKILEMINSVAKNTRILGFNAGIEAARSGEHGKGFSVVAKEITKLADQSADSVNEIRQLLNSMKDKVGEVTQTIDETLTISTSQSSSIIEISQAIQHLAKIAEDIEELAQTL
ncbi:methyl-accepting chemotaxis protein [Solibacillus sp. CAU 1738]|uniref:methyl-accepting chemotaxis protein n=1 Tax=Solibacillus sp. CAU 1738 TaxID=3140363 RepID=UPI0032617DAA